MNAGCPLVGILPGGGIPAGELGDIRAADRALQGSPFPLRERGGVRESRNEKVLYPHRYHPPDPPPSEGEGNPRLSGWTLTKTVSPCCFLNQALAKKTFYPLLQ